MDAAAVDRFDRWIRQEFVERNTELEEAYFSARREIVHDPHLDTIKRMIRTDGAKLIAPIVEDGGMPPGAQERYRLLGAVGFYLASCRRHEVDGPDGAEELSAAWSLANLLGSSLGVVPRFVFAHQSFYNPAVHDAYRTFTSLDDESVFITYNALAALAYRRAAHALRSVPPMGVSNPMATYLLEDARAALDDVMEFQRTLGRTLDVDRFFFNVRPYFKPYRVGGTEYRGANAGDFSAINELDVLLGLCDPRDPFYQGILAEKRPYLPPEDQARLRGVVTAESLLEAFLREAAAGPVTPRLRENAEHFLALCRAHGTASSFHHHKLVKPFLEEPARDAPEERRKGITASGPPLEVVMAWLARLSDLRAARDLPGSARLALERLRNLIADGARTDG
ncbi:monodechloroaminopyrrolnitrin synthase PrnB family protein [Actinomadura craniellae]|nr:monodechloroaminopyrrolnitrin synthase PrnB family protein [Actinomadura craniellae]